MDTKDCWLKNRCNHKDCDGFCLRMFKLNALYNEALIYGTQRTPVRFTAPDAIDLDSFKKLKSIESNIVDFVNSGKNIYIFSSKCGNGKTSWALRLVSSYLDKIWETSPLSCRVLFINIPRYLLALKDSIDEKNDYVEHIKKNVLTADIVVWDEIGNKDMTQFELDNILSLINARIDYGKSNIYTSNAYGDNLKKMIGERLYSRVYNGSEIFEFCGEDKRGLKK